MSTSGISDANPIMPAAWSPPSQEAAEPAQQQRRRDADDGAPPKPTEAQRLAPHLHKVDVRA